MPIPSPRWYRQRNKAAKPMFAWHPGCPPVYPRIESGAEFCRRQFKDNNAFAEARAVLGRNAGRAHDPVALRKYIAAFDAVMHFKPAYPVTP